MYHKSIAAAVLLASATILPGLAQAASSGYTVGRADMQAGPDYDYPTVRVIRDGRRVTINGCLNDWSWRRWNPA